VIERKKQTMFVRRFYSIPYSGQIPLKMKSRYKPMFEEYVSEIIKDKLRRIEDAEKTN